MSRLLSFKKDVLGLLLLFAIAVSSCTNEDEVLKSNKVEPGIYMIEMTIDTQNAETRGVQSNNDFDTNYDPDYIYLHCGEKALYIPVYDYCEDCATGFRYVIEVTDDGSAILTPIDENGEYMDEYLDIPRDNSTCYFSSLESDVWELLDDQIDSTNFLDNTEYYYRRKSDINKEIYRSASNYSISDLASNGDLTVVRACAGFNLVGLFYDGDEASNIDTDSDEHAYVTLTESEFSAIMEDDYTNWYIKIYIGGNNFTDKYDLSKEESVGIKTSGYYSSGDGDLFASGVPDRNEYLQFSSRSFGSGSIVYYGYGYYTRSGNHLFTPVTGGEVNVYVLIKHWTGNGDPSEEWLLGDTDAIYTQVKFDATLAPINNSFYTLGLLMDIRQFKNAWDAMWNTDAGVEGSGDEQEVSTRSLESTRSLGLKASREFYLKDAKVICESH